MIDTVLSHVPVWNGWIALLLYWAPLVLCTVGYSVRGVKKYRGELTQRAKAEADPKKEFYYPELSVGDLVAHVFAATCPVVNLLCLIFDVGGDMIRHFFWTIGSLLDIKLVPKRRYP